MKVLLSINPEHVEKIFRGEKKYEFRKALFKKEGVHTVVVYSTMPVGKIVGEFKVKSILKEQPDHLWVKTFKFAGIDKHFFDTYFFGRERGYAIEIGDFIKYDNPYLPEHFTAPQSFMYWD